MFLAEAFSLSFKLKGTGVESVIGALFRKQLFVAASLDYASVIHDHDDVGIHYGAEPVCDNKHRSALHERIHAALHYRLGAGVDGACRLVEYHDRRIGDRRSCYRNELPLTLREVCTVVAKKRVVALRQTAYEVVGSGDLGCTAAVLVRCVEVSVADVFHDAAGKRFVS